MRVTISNFTRLAMLGVAATTTAMAASAASLPPVHTEGDVTYLSGGIGQGEVRAIERSESKWPLTLEFAQHDRSHADFVADVAVVVRGMDGRPSLHATSDGPFMLAKLPAGRYAVDATLDGRTLHRQVTVREGAPTSAVFVWPTGTDNG
jgi:hypothetical protein